VTIINHLANELNDYLSGEKNEMDSETDSEVLDPTAAGMGDSLQGGTPQGKEGVPEKDIKNLFAIDEEEIGTDIEEQTGETGATRAATQTEEERLTQSKIEQQLDLDGAGSEGVSTGPQQRCSLADIRHADGDQQHGQGDLQGRGEDEQAGGAMLLAVVKRQLESFRVPIT
jgi:hypothetical protein